MPSPNSTAPKKKLAWHPKRWLSGEHAKTFRRNLGATAPGGNHAYTLTFKFPLAAEEPSEDTRAALRLQYEKLASIREYSLFHFFAAIHLAGFRLFTSKAAASLFVNGQAINESDFSRSLDDRFGVGLSAGASLIQAMAGEFRTRGKQQPTHETVLKRLLTITEFADAKPRTHGAVKPQLHKFLDAVARRIATNELFGRDNNARLQAVCETARKQGWPLTIPTLSIDCEYPIVHDHQAAKFLQEANHSVDGLAYTMHTLVAHAAHVSRRNGTDNISEKHIKAVLLSDDANYNALAWLFNPDTGLKFFAEKSDKDIRKALHVSGECLTLQIIKDIAGNLIKAPIIKYNDFRSLFGGHIASFVSNYWKRLNELKKGIESIKNAEHAKSVALQLKALDSSGDIVRQFVQTSVPIEKLDDLIGVLVARKTKTKATAALESLMGIGNHLAGKQDIGVVETFNERYEECLGVAMQLAEVVRRYHKRKKRDFSDTTSANLLPKWLLPKNAKETDDDEATTFLKRKINRYRGAKIYSPDAAQQQLDADTESLRRLSEARNRHWETLQDGRGIDIVAAHMRTLKERVDSDKHLKNEKEDFLDLACRNILQRMARAIRDCDSKIIQAGHTLFAKHGVFANTKDANKFFIHRQGNVYVSPFSTRRHEPYPLGTGFADEKKREQTVTLVRAFADWVETLKTAQVSMRDMAQLEKCLYALRVGGLQDTVPVDVAKPKAGHDDTEDVESALSAMLRLTLDKNRDITPGENRDITPGEMGKIFNAYASKINGLCARLVRERFIVKARLQYIDDKALYWLPTAHRDWVPPTHVLHGKHALAQGWKHLLDEKLVTDGKKITGSNMAKAVEALSAMKNTQAFSACLRQMPHDWYFKVGGATGNYPMLTPSGKHHPDHQQLTVTDDDKNTLLGGLVEIKSGKIAPKKEKKDRNPQHYIRLTGPSRFKGWLDKALKADGNPRVSFGDTSLIVEEEYRQSLNGHAPQVNHERTRVEAAVVFKVEHKGGNDDFPWNKFIAIDLGERGIGYAVFDVPDNAATMEVSPTKTGHVAVPILRRLIKRVDNYRGRTQPRQRFQSNLNTALQQMREATIGELAGVIDALMERHKAFPVFESSVSGFESGGKQLKMVYGSILQLYTLSGVPAHKKKRAEHWLRKQDPQWKHPALYKVDTAHTQPKKGALLSMFPGVSVNPAGTSQTCSEYGKNPLDLLATLSQGTIRSDDRGILMLGDTPIYLYGQPSKNTKRQDRQRKENPLPAIADLWKNGTFRNGKELSKHITAMLRHKPPSLRSRDTTQSSYLSPFVDTQQHLKELSDDDLKARHMFRRGGLVYMHADVNAAVNIGRKWWKEKVWHGKQ